jgi:hypothetical protein
MDSRLLLWLEQNTGKTILSPREAIFNRKTKQYQLVSVNKRKGVVKITFIMGSLGLPLYFWMFDRALQLIHQNPNNIHQLGAKVSPPYEQNSIEEAIWRPPYHGTPYKVSPFICDLLVLSGLTKYNFTLSKKNRRVQGAQSILNSDIIAVDKMVDLSQLPDDKSRFIQKNEQFIIKWIEEHEKELVNARNSYSWGKKTTGDCIKERNELSQVIIKSRIVNAGGIDLNTLDKIIRWGFNRDFPLRNEEQVKQITRKAFDYLDKGDLSQAAITLMQIDKVGISRATKILGLYDQENLCIYDSRVGAALFDLRNVSEKLILCPPGYGRKYDPCSSSGYAKQYQRLIWLIQFIRDYLNERGYIFRAADIEMGLFMMGK